ncbi:hypothetical protein ACOSQ3_019849 [Xanthoceras sorbifolium]
MVAYLEKTRRALGRFTKFRITQIPRAENLKADALSKLASATNVLLSKTVPVAHLLQPSTCEEDDLIVAEVNLAEATWITPIRAYLEQGILPEDKNEAKRLRYRAARYTMMNGEMYRRGFYRTLQRCVDPQESARILQAIHGGVCGNHAGGNSLAHKALRQGFYWPTMFQDAKETASNCDKCQRIADNIKQPQEKLRSLTSPWPFAQWGIDLIGPMPTAKGQAKYAIVLHQMGRGGTFSSDN